MISCRKRPYTATAIQWDGHNFNQVCEMLEPAGCEVDLYGEDMIMLRSAEGIKTLRLGDYVVRGENGSVKTYTDKIFTTKYEVSLA